MYIKKGVWYKVDSRSREIRLLELIKLYYPKSHWFLAFPNMPEGYSKSSIIEYLVALDKNNEVFTPLVIQISNHGTLYRVTLEEFEEKEEEEPVVFYPRNPVMLYVSGVSYKCEESLLAFERAAAFGENVSVRLEPLFDLYAEGVFEKRGTHEEIQEIARGFLSVGVNFEFKKVVEEDET